MPKIYPYNSDKLCLFCEIPITIYRKRHKDKIFCSEVCRVEYLKKRKKEQIPNKNCNMCNKLFFSKKKGKAYCSRSCDIEYRKKTYDRVCLTCGKSFKAKNISHIKRGDYIYCSHECTNKKYYFNELCFSNENAESMYWLGFMFAAIKTVTERYLEIEDTKIMIEGFLKFIKGDIKVNKVGNLYKICLYSRRYVKIMETIGIRLDFYKEAPLIQREYIKDFIRGFFDTKKGFIYKDKDKNVVAIHSEDSKLMRYFADMLGGFLRYKEKEWIVVSFDFEIICNGFPRNNIKWKKFGNNLI